MRWVDLKDSLSNFWFEFRRQKTGILGIVLLIFWIIIALGAPYITQPDIPDKWKTVWIDYPKTVPPTWTGVFSGVKEAPHLIIPPDELQKYVTQSENKIIIDIPYNMEYDVPPQDIVLMNISGKSKGRLRPVLSLKIKRPDGEEITLLQGFKIKGSTNIQIARDSNVRRRVLNWVKMKTGIQIDPNKEFEYMTTMDTLRVIFAKVTPDMLDKPQPLKGEYHIIYEIKLFKDTSVDISHAELVLTGRTYGYLGTDDKGRDLFAGIIWGSRVSLAVGITTAVLSVLIGIFYGVTAAYFGGWTDELMMRFQEFMASIPTLPILILLGTYFGGHIQLWQIVLLLAVFGWVGIARVARSMAYQIKEQTYVEAAIALGAGTGRIIFKHMVPQLLPYAFAQMALNVPGAVLAEASLSFLGLGDPTQVTWGQILHDAQVAGAAVNGYWWWVIPPGLAIALVALTFVLIGTALDRVLNPRLRRL
ncbi:oligopeptide transport system permease protein appC [Pyrococcus sp. NA2]|uniref:ABC transporter permease n=1 Tax=Pyrococcus sp. (strain NA2) TaxID=342949 RepID=UPI000209AF7A|nr:ABC transporter permease [Pyrococcus sp. NA2]AEC51764.1 oligopeptide transport system permease protein appC [Pyrococcus sp. NA2]